MSDKVTLPIVMIGGGGHASVLAEILLNQGRNILAVISPEDISQHPIFEGITLLEKDEDILKFDKDKILLVNGIGMMPKSNVKRQINEYFLSLGYKFETIIADSAYISPSAVIESGAQILHVAIVNTGAKVGAHSILNTASVVEHDCNIGAYNHLAPRSLLCGQVKTGMNVFVGANATVINNISIGEDSVIGAGCTIRKKIDDNVIAY